MPKYQYTQLRVMCVEGPYYRLDQMREAVEYLKGVPQTGWTGLQATVPVRTEKISLLAQPILQLSEIVGKVPAEVWAMFDAKVDATVADHEAMRSRTYRHL